MVWLSGIKSAARTTPTGIIVTTIIAAKNADSIAARFFLQNASTLLLFFSIIKPTFF